MEFLGVVGDVSLQAAGHGESGIGPSALPSTLRPARFTDPTFAARDTGIGTSASAAAEDADKSELPQGKLKRLERLKLHLEKFINRFKTDELVPSRQCACEAERW